MRQNQNTPCAVEGRIPLGKYASEAGISLDGPLLFVYGRLHTAGARWEDDA